MCANKGSIKDILSLFPYGNATLFHITVTGERHYQKMLGDIKMQTPIDKDKDTVVFAINMIKRLLAKKIE